MRLASVPSGADVFKILENGEKEIVGDTSTDLFLTEVPVGNVAYEMLLEGYRPKRVEGIVIENETIALGGMLEFFNPPLNDSIWNNSLGMTFVPKDGAHISLFPMNLSVFENFIKEKQQTIDYHEANIYVTGQENSEELRTALVGEKTASLFFEWLTFIERQKGYLSDNQYYILNKGIDHEKSDVKYGKDVFEQRFPLFASVRSPSYAQLEIQSFPSSASVFLKDMLIGKTNLTLSDIKPERLEIILRLKGYRDEKRIVELQPNIDHYVSVRMRLSAGADMTKKWNNSLGVPMIPLKERVMVAAWETRNKDYEFYCSLNNLKKDDIDSSADLPNYPKANISIYEINHFCDWLTNYERDKGLISFSQRYQLPKDEDWSLAAGLEDEKGQSPSARDKLIDGKFPWGSNWPPDIRTLNMADKSSSSWASDGKFLESYSDDYPLAAPVGTFPPNKNGFYDLSGNVWEWVEELYGGQSSFSQWAVARGGSYESYKKQSFLSSYRNVQIPEKKGLSYGFRLALYEDD